MPPAPQSHIQATTHQFEDISGKKKRKSEWEDHDQETTSLLGVPKAAARRRSKSSKKANSLSPNVHCQQASPTSSTPGVIDQNNQLLVPKVEMDTSTAAGVIASSMGARPTTEIGAVVDEDLAAAAAAAATSTPGNSIHIDPAVQGEETPNGTSSSMENWSEQPTMKVKVKFLRLFPEVNDSNFRTLITGT